MKNIIHWCKQKKMWTSHTYKTCTKAEIILINGQWLTETKPNKKDNPRGWVVTGHENVVINPSPETLSLFYKKEKLLYDKYNIEFNHLNGENLLFDGDGCFTIEKFKE